MGIAKYVVHFMGKTMKSWSLLIAGQTIEEAEDTETKWVKKKVILPHSWISLNNSKMVKALTLEFYSIQ